MPRYCNITTDIYRAFPRIEEFKEAKTLKGWSVHSGDIYKLPFTGHGEVLFQSGTQLSSVASLGAVAAGKFFYDTDVDILYAQATSGAITSYTMKWGVDWDTLKGWAADLASQRIDALLDPRFPVPVPEDPYGTSSRKYDGPLINATALMSAAIIMGRTQQPRFADDGSPENATAELEKAARDIIKRYNDGEMRFSWEVSQDEIGGANVIPGSLNTSVGMFQIKGDYSGGEDERWIVKVSTGGDVGTAQYQLSRDNGTSYATAVTTGYGWTALAAGIWIRFFGRGGAANAFILNDTWELEVTSPQRSQSSPRIGNVRLIA